MSSLIGIIRNHLSDQLYTSPTAFLILFIALLVPLSWMGLFTNKKANFDPCGKHCYVGGGSEGLGLALACLLADRGAHVSIVSRSEDKLKKALVEIETHRQNPSQIFKSYSCDLTSTESSITTLNAACSAHNSLSPDFIFACAGSSTPKFFLDATPDEHWKFMEYNYKTTVCTIHEGVKRMKEEGKRGKVVLTASVLGMMGFAGYSTYAPSKFAIRGLADSLRNEFLLYDISIHLFLPATIFSPSFFEHESKIKPDLCKKIEGADEGMSPLEVAKRMIWGLERNDFYITYEPVGHMLRNSRGIVPWNNWVFDTLWGWAGTIGFPLWRIFFADREVKKEKAKLQNASK
ncbi:putative oxidoreductase [Meredithblackwellia eburnea MCA 4105]